LDLFFQGLKQAVFLIASRDPQIIEILLLSLKISGIAIFISIIFGIPVGTIIALNRFHGRRFTIALINTGMGFPPVVIGLFVSIFLWRSGLFGFLNILYTPTAMVVAQTIIAFPIITGLTVAAIQHVNPKLNLQAQSLGASKWQVMFLLIKEARLPLLAAVMAGFGGIISEVGAVMMVGGNIKGQTRVLTTATLLETKMGHFDIAIALSFILLVIALSVNICLTHIQQKEKS
jgi:tungstate transport system permease protein